VSSGNGKVRTWLEPMHVNLRSCNGAKVKWAAIVSHTTIRWTQCPRKSSKGKVQEQLEPYALDLRAGDGAKLKRSGVVNP